MTAAEWRKRVRGDDLYGSLWRDVIADLGEMERSYRINLDALAESERLREKAEEERDDLKKLAIGGEGETHWYYRDAYSVAKHDCDDLRRKLESKP